MIREIWRMFLIIVGIFLIVLGGSSKKEPNKVKVPYSGKKYILKSLHKPITNGRPTHNKQP